LKAVRKALVRLSGTAALKEEKIEEEKYFLRFTDINPDEYILPFQPMK
jgi:hypothetical protein